MTHTIELPKSSVQLNEFFESPTAEGQGEGEVEREREREREREGKMPHRFTVLDLLSIGTRERQMKIIHLLPLFLTLPTSPLPPSRSPYLPSPSLTISLPPGQDDIECVRLDSSLGLLVHNLDLGGNGTRPPTIKQPSFRIRMLHYVT